MRRATTLFGLGLALGACGGGGGGAADMGAGVDQGGGAAEVCTSDGKPPAVTGRYGIKAALTVNVKVPGDCEGDSCIVDKDAASTLLLLADITQNGTMITVSAAPCAITIPPVALKGQPEPTILTAPDAVVQSVKAVSATALLTGAQTCATLSSTPLAIVLGARLADPVADVLPKFVPGGKTPYCGGSVATPCDAAMGGGCVCDQDVPGDGKPGATVVASGVAGVDVDRIYLALRTVVSLDGAVFPATAGQPYPGQRIKGTVLGLKLEQSPLGCRQSNGDDCNDQTVGAVVSLNPKVTQSVNTKSVFVAMPMPSDATCARVVAEKDSLFRGQ